MESRVQASIKTKRKDWPQREHMKRSLKFLLYTSLQVEMPTAAGQECAIASSGGMESSRAALVNIFEKVFGVLKFMDTFLLTSSIGLFVLLACLYLVQRQHPPQFPPPVQVHKPTVTESKVKSVATGDVTDAKREIENNSVFQVNGDPHVLVAGFKVELQDFWLKHGLDFAIWWKAQTLEQRITAVLSVAPHLPSNLVGMHKLSSVVMPEVPPNRTSALVEP